MTLAQRTCRFGWWMLVLVGLACSLIVPEEPDVIYCSRLNAVGQPDCLANSICTGDICMACTTNDACGDGVDNNCNGMVDEACPLGWAGAAGALDR